MDGYNRSEDREYMKLAYLPEMAMQFRDGEMIVSIEWPGWGVLYDSGFSTDISQKCIWLTSYVMEPSDPTFVKYALNMCDFSVNN